MNYRTAVSIMMLGCLPLACAPRLHVNYSPGTGKTGHVEFEHHGLFKPKVRCTLDGSPLGQIGSDQTLGQDDLRMGPHEVKVQSVRNGLTATEKLHLRSGDRQNATVEIRAY